MSERELLLKLKRSGFWIKRKFKDGKSQGYELEHDKKEDISVDTATIFIIDNSPEWLKERIVLWTIIWLVNKVGPILTNEERKMLEDFKLPTWAKNEEQ